MEPISVSWDTFKDWAVIKKKLKVQELLGTDNVYNLLAFDGSMGASCRIAKDNPPSSDQDDYENNYQSASNKAGEINVITSIEKPDKDLVLASDDQPFIGNVCTLSLYVPGNLGDLGTRQIAGGYVFTDKYYFGDRASKCALLDKDYSYAGSLYPATPLEAGVPNSEGLAWSEVYPDGFVLGTYTDDELPENNRGWRLWADDGGQGGADIDTIGGFGLLLSCCYLVITLEKKQDSTATRGAFNAWWGKTNL